GQEVVAARLLDELRQVARIAEHVGQPQGLRLHPELAYEESLAMQQLTHERLAARKVAVRLDPHRANGLPLAGRDLLFHPFVQVGIRLLDPRVLRTPRAREHVLGNTPPRSRSVPTA